MEKAAKLRWSIAAIRDQSCPASEGKMPRLETLAQEDPARSSTQLGPDCCTGKAQGQAALCPAASLLSQAKFLIPSCPARKPCAVFPSGQGPEPAARVPGAHHLPADWAAGPQGCTHAAPPEGFGGEKAIPGRKAC